MLFPTESALNPPFIDLHTHRRTTASGVVSIANFSQKDFQNTENTEGYDFGLGISDFRTSPAEIRNPQSEIPKASVGLHPWFLTKENYKNDFKKLTQLIDNQNIVAIGECGLDKLRGEDLGFQTAVFEAQIRLAESVSKPVIVHCVRAFNEVIAVKKRLNPKIPLVIHGFNKNTHILEELLRHGFFISIGAAILSPSNSKLEIQTPKLPNTEGSSFAKNLLKIPIDRLFFETDDAENVAIETIYETAANVLSMDINHLKSIIYENFVSTLNDNMDHR